MRAPASRTRRAAIVRNDDGAAAVEFSLIALLLMLITFGILDFGLMLWQWNMAEKATHIGVRTAAVSDFVAADLATFPAAPASDVGTPCTNPTTGVANPDCSFATVTCTSAGCSSFGFSATAFNRIVTAMQQIDPYIAAENVQITYAANGLGFVGRPGGLPVTVTVQLIGRTFRVIVLDVLLGTPGELAMPGFAATLIGEDMSTSST
jgi:Flp pilus assembly protein TadG